LIAAVAAEMELALWCDFRVMEQSTYFGVYCRHWGIPFGDKVAIPFPLKSTFF
jgi:enoyl-CoA hydratase